MRTLTRRLSRLEAQDRRTTSAVVSVFWDDDLVPCTVHAACGIEPDSGVHHAGLVRLSLLDAIVERPA